MNEKLNQDNVFLSFLYFYGVMNDNCVCQTLKYLNRRSFIEHLENDFKLSDKQIKAIVSLMVLRALECGANLPKGYIDLFNFADGKGLFEIAV